MDRITRRGFVVAGSALVLAGCADGRVTGSGPQISSNVQAALQNMYTTLPGTRELAQQAAGMLVMPSITRAGLVLGGAYGEGALLIGDAIVDFYSVASASLGLQIGAQQFSHVLMFMTPEALRDFRLSDGWQVGADAEVAFENDGAAVGVSSTTANRPIVAIAFGNRGLIAGATLSGAKYSRLIR